jgi:hypothetical protein
MKAFRAHLIFKGIIPGSLIIVLFLVVSPGLLQPVQSSVSSFMFGPSIGVGETGPRYWYGGACVDNSSVLENTGARTMIDVKSQYVNGFLAFWTSESFSGGLWAQVGYYIYKSSVPVGFYQTWNLSTHTEISSATSSVSTGEHIFSFALKSDRIVFAIDGKDFGQFQSRGLKSSSSFPLCSLSEEGYSSSPFPFRPVTFEIAMQVLKSGTWTDVERASSFGNSWGIQGQLENSSLFPNEIVVGQNISPPSSTTLLWT